MFEVYMTDPETTPNPAEWLTEVYIPIIIAPEPVEEGI
jgi:effector-binding domain-containing protein